MDECAATNSRTEKDPAAVRVSETLGRAARFVLRAAPPLGLLIGQVTLALAAGAAAPSGAAGANSKALNIVVVLDLSDRIDPVRHPGQAEQDLKVLDGLVTIFEEKVRRGLYLLSRDRLVFAVAPQTTNYQRELSAVADSLRINMPELNSTGADRGKPGFDKARARLREGLLRLYGRASASGSYVGADIWSFFRDRLDSYLSPDPNVRNLVVVVTDGYINFEKDEERTRPRSGARTSFMQVAGLRQQPRWEARFDREDLGLISFGDRFRGVEVVVTGLRYIHLDDQPVVGKYWTKWLTEMGATRIRLLPADDSSVQMGEVLRACIS